MTVEVSIQMKKTTSIITTLIVGLCIMSYFRNSIEQSSPISETVAILKIDATDIDANSANNFVSNSNFSSLKLVTDDDRKL